MECEIRPGDIIVSRYGEKIKLVCMKFSPRGVVLPSLCERAEQPAEIKLSNSISRTRRVIYELAACNNWEWFVTLTLDEAKRDRYDLASFRRDFAQFVRNFNRLHKQNVKYLLIPEQHKDGAWHMHGLLSGLSDSNLVRNSYGYYDWSAYSSRFGFMSLSKIRSHERVSAYITKYITKDMSARLHEVGAHLYYASKGLNKAQLIGVYRERGKAGLNWDFENDWVKSKWVTLNEFDNIAPVIYNKKW